MASTVTPAANELERRKSLRIRLRTDLNIEAHKYEGRTFYVVKDPVSLRYYRLKDNEHFLLKFLDGRQTLESAQKAYEREFRPERLKLEDLEGFAQQLLTAGLALSESPKAGQQLFERRGKRQRSEWMQTLTNILYIKIPIFDPERLLQKMLVFLGWIFSMWFGCVSVLFMLSAVLLVTTHFETFYQRLPDYHYYFQFKQAIYLWITLGVVKVIHEFGHGLSCKVFGGEVHEMGGLLLCFSPALYCNVSDAWILPHKWHRIMISAAGIYVELVIAAAATWVWWCTPTQPFINNLSLSLMVVCSVSTFVFNANPLMRYDGYYVMADWLEIPNLREKSNRFLKNLVLDKCLGVEVPPEEYMDGIRKILFVSYAVVSYVYRWVITFGILHYFSEFLKPYKLEIIGYTLTLASILSMTVWPVYRLFKGIHRRGRLPDMKRVRATISASVLAVVIGFLFLVPVPISRIRGLALVQAHPDATVQVVLKRSAILDQLKAQAGDEVKQGAVLAVFRDPDLEDKLISALADFDNARLQLELLQSQKKQTVDVKELRSLEEEIVRTTGKRDTAHASVVSLQHIKDEELVLLAPQAGVIGTGPSITDIGRQFEGARDQGGIQPTFTIHGHGQLRAWLPLSTSEFNQLRENVHELRKENRKNGTDKQLAVSVRVHGLDSSQWQGTIARLDESEMKNVPPLLSNRYGGPVAIKPPTGKSQALIPMAQNYLAYIDLDATDNAIAVGSMAQVKISLRHETCASFAWRKINDTFNLKLSMPAASRN